MLNLISLAISFLAVRVLLAGLRARNVLELVIAAGEALPV